MGNVIEFNNNKKEYEKETIEEGTMNLSMPSEMEIKALNYITDTYDKDEPVCITHWNGDCWKSFFNFVKEYAEKHNFDEWDCMAVLITKMMGTKFEYTDDGQLQVITPGPINKKED